MSKCPVWWLDMFQQGNGNVSKVAELNDSQMGGHSTNSSVKSVGCFNGASIKLRQKEKISESPSSHIFKLTYLSLKIKKRKSGHLCNFKSWSSLMLATL